MTDYWDGKCSVCGVQIRGNPDEELFYDLDELSAPAYCKTCYDMMERERRVEALSSPTLWVCLLLFLLIILSRLGL